METSSSSFCEPFSTLTLVRAHIWCIFMSSIHRITSHRLRLHRPELDKSSGNFPHLVPLMSHFHLCTWVGSVCFLSRGKGRITQSGNFVLERLHFWKIPLRLIHQQKPHISLGWSLQFIFAQNEHCGFCPLSLTLELHQERISWWRACSRNSSP